MSDCVIYKNQNLLNSGKPTAHAIERPAALHKENLPPTHSHIGNMF